MQAQVLLQPIERARTLAMRQVGRNRVGSFLDRRKTRDGALTHEALHLGNAALIDARRNVYEDDRREDRPPAGALGCAVREQRRDAAERRADRDRMLAAALAQR